MKKFYAFLFVPIFLLASLTLYAGRAGGSDPAAVDCPPPTPDQISVSGVTGSVARLHSTIVGVSSYYWRYSAVGSGIWMHAGSTAANFIDLAGLLPNANYEYQAKVLCSNGEYGNWSASEFFTTANAPSSCNDPVVMQCGVNYNGANTGAINTFDYYWGPAYEATGMFYPVQFQRPDHRPERPERRP
jgi:chitodextrinase